MIFIYQKDQTITLTDDPYYNSKPENKLSELIGQIKDPKNIPTILEKYEKKYTVKKEYNEKKFWSIHSLSSEQEQKRRRSISRAKSNQPLTLSHKMAISDSLKGRPSNFKGKQHTEYSKAIISSKRGDRDPIQGRRWCHDPLTGKEKRQFELPPGYRWGRTPEMNDWLGR